MRDRWVISDTHFGHVNILNFCPSRRVLGETIQEHDEALIARWNATVKPKDVVYHLGDVAFGHRKNDLSWVKSLNGYKALLRGNHDTGQYHKWADVFHELLPSAMPVPRMGEAVFSHVPIHPVSLAKRWSFNIHGHLHEAVINLRPMRRIAPVPDSRFINVCVEHIDFRPIHFDELRERMKKSRGWA